MDGRPTAVNCYYYNLQPKYLRKQNVVGINREMSFPESFVQDAIDCGELLYSSELAGYDHMELCSEKCKP